MTETIYVYKNKTGATEPLRAVKDESGAHTYMFKILDENDNVVSLSGAMTASFYVQRPDKVIVETPCTVNGWDVTCTPAIGSYQVAGACKCFLQIIGNSALPTADQRFSGISLLVKGEPLSGATGAGVSSVNGMTGDVVLNFSDIGEDGKDWIKDAGQKAIDQLMDEKGAEFDQYLRLLQNIDIADNKAAYLAFLSRAAIPANVKLYNALARTYRFPPSGAYGGDNLQFDRYEWYNQVNSPITVSDSDYVGSTGGAVSEWIRLTGKGDMLLSAGINITYNFASVTPSGVINQPCSGKVRVITHTVASNITTTVGTFYFSAAETEKSGVISISIPKFLLHISESTDISFSLSIDQAALINTLTGSFTQTDGTTVYGRSYCDMQIMPDLTRFPTSQMPRIVDVTASTQDIQPGDALPKDSLYLVIEP